MYNFAADWATPHFPNWRKFLGHLVDKPINALEIGCWEGRSTFWFVENILKHPDSKLYCIDIWNTGDTMKKFFANLAICPVIQKIYPSRINSKVFSYPVDFYDFIYVDGSHKPCDALPDFVRSWDALKPGGIFIMDDYKFSTEMTECVDIFLKMIYYQSDILHKSWQVILKKT